MRSCLGVGPRYEFSQAFTLCLEVANLAKVSFQSFELSLFAKIRPHSHKKTRKHSVTRYFMLKKYLQPSCFSGFDGSGHEARPSPRGGGDGTWGWLVIVLATLQ